MTAVWALARLAAAVLLLGALAACASPAGPAARAETTTVDLPASYRFDPVDISVAAGSTVTWTNHDHFSHSVRFLDGGLPTEPLVMDPGQSVTFTFDSTGVFRYECHLHPQNMRGSVEVTRT